MYFRDKRYLHILFLFLYAVYPVPRSQHRRMIFNTCNSRLSPEYILQTLVFLEKNPPYKYDNAIPYTHGIYME